jgi:hypothetical protein
LKALTITTALVAVSALPALAEGTLNIYNFGLYTPPDLIEKFEKTYGVDVTLTEYDSNETALAKIEAGGHGFDIILTPTRCRTLQMSIPHGSMCPGIQAGPTPCRGSGAQRA